jgi:recombination protein RecA
LGQAVFSRSDILPASRLATSTPAGAPEWSTSALAGRLAELSADGAAATLTLALGLVLDAQQRGEPVVWITTTGASFFPPDAADGGVDLAALVVVRVASPPQIFRVADHLARSGGFGLLVLDLGVTPMPAPAQTRLAGLAAHHGLLLLCLTRKDGEAPSLGSQVSLRAAAVREHRGNGTFACRAQVLKDKRHRPGWSHTELCRGPDGLR